MKQRACVAVFILMTLTQPAVAQAKSALCAFHNSEAATCKSTKDCNDACVRVSKTECQYSCKRAAILDPVTKTTKSCKTICVDKTGSLEECGPGLNKCDCSCKFVKGGSLVCGHTALSAAPYECVIARQCGIGSLGSTLLWCSDPQWNGQPTCQPMPKNFCPPPDAKPDPATSPCAVNFCAPSVFEKIRSRGWGL